MLEDAKKTITELGYMDSLQRRFATLNDISVNNVLFSNKEAARKMTDADDIFEQMEKDVVVNPKKFSKVEEISAQDFIDKVLPTAKEIEAFVENRHEKNFDLACRRLSSSVFFTSALSALKTESKLFNDKVQRSITFTIPLNGN